VIASPWLPGLRGYPKRQVFVHVRRPCISSKAALLVAWLIVIPIVGLLFSEGYVRCAQQISLALAAGCMLIWLFRNAGTPYATLALIAGRLATVAVATIFIEPYYLSTTGLDAELYHSVGMQVAESLWNNGKFPIIGLNWGTNGYGIYTGICYLLFGVSPLAIKLLNTGIAAAGSVLFYRAFVLHYRRTNQVLRVLLFFSPALLYWSSIHGKDPLTFFSLGLGFFGIAKFAKEGSNTGLFLCLLGGLFLFFIRPHIACVYLAALSLVFLLLSFSKKRSVMARFASIACLTFVILGANFVVHDYLQGGVSSADAILEGVSAQHDALDSGKTALDVPNLTGWESAVEYLPYGAATVMFRPFPWENGGLFFRLTSLEQLALTAAEIVFIGYFLVGLFQGSLRGIYGVISRLSKDALATFVCAYLVGFVLLFTYIAGNLGTLAREKIQLAPFVWCGAFAVVSRCHNSYWMKATWLRHILCRER